MGETGTPARHPARLWHDPKHLLRPTLRRLPRLRFVGVCV